MDSSCCIPFVVTSLIKSRVPAGRCLAVKGLPAPLTLRVTVWSRDGGG